MTTLALGRGTTERLLAYARLAKLSFFDYYLSALVAVTLVPSPVRSSGRAWATLAVLTAGWVAVVAAAVSLDDVTGYVDGSDQLNYDPRQQALRNRSRKPLLDGHLSVRDALRFAGLAVLAAAVVLAGAVAIAPHRPAWAAALVALVLLAGVQYSYGLRLSYHGGQELVLLVTTGLTVLVPVGLLTGRCPAPALAEAWLFGLWSLLVSVYSNLNDVEGDRAAGRRTMAVVCSPAAYRGLVGILICSEPMAAALPAALGRASWWLPVTVAPILAMHVRQARIGLPGGAGSAGGPGGAGRVADPLAARRLGIRAHRWGIAALIAANLLMVNG
ncbi:MAG: UbiA family prenyltransferase [Frankiaceae bacterium]